MFFYTFLLKKGVSRKIMSLVHLARSILKELTCKPGSVEDSHSSGTDVTACLLRPTRFQRGSRKKKPIWSCTERGLPCHGCYQPRGALLPHLFTLTSFADES